jgi:hypothetical protein
MTTTETVTTATRTATIGITGIPNTIAAGKTQGSKGH